MSSTYSNILLNLMQDEVREAVLANAEHVSLQPLEIVQEAYEPVKFVFFPEGCVFSLIAALEGERDVEVGVIGAEGATSEAIVLGGDRCAYALHAQITGTAWRVPVDAFRSALNAHEPLRSLMLNFVAAQHAQVVSTLLARSRGTIEERLARWILMTLDRTGGDHFSITHASLAWLLCTQRPRVTDAMHILEGNRVVRSTRGEITMLDRPALEAATGGTYGNAEGEYHRLLGVDFRSKLTSSSTRLYGEPDRQIG